MKHILLAIDTKNLALIDQFLETQYTDMSRSQLFRTAVMDYISRKRRQSYAIE